MSQGLEPSQNNMIYRKITEIKNTQNAKIIVYITVVGEFLTVKSTHIQWGRNV